MMARSHVVDSVLAAILLVLTFGASPSASQKGFQLINCGGEAYIDPNTTLNWDTDPYNESNNVLIHGKVGKVNSSTNVMTTLRYFPDNSRNNKFCYSLNISNGNKYMLRASFLYGNYDGINQPPNFVLIINSDVWTNVNTSSSTIPIIHELIFLSNDRSDLNICLARSFNSNQTPFISTFELTTLESTMYTSLVGALSRGYGLMLWQRINYGAISEAEIRYPDDEFDRIWEPNTIGPIANTSKKNMDYELDPDKPPAEVMATAITSNSSTGNLSLTYENFGGFGGFRIEMYFQEVDEEARNQRARNLSIVIGPGEMIRGITIGLDAPNYQVVDVIGQISFPFHLTLVPEPGSLRGPLLNAIELYQWTPQPLTMITTFQSDVNAIKPFLANFNLMGYGQGDPCMPQDYAWTWIDCNEDNPPRIININLASFNLIGSIPSSINNLTSLQRVDLSNNSLSGQIPNVNLLVNLEYLDLHNNTLTGELPSSLLSLPKLANLDISYNDLCGSFLSFQPFTNYTYIGNKRLCSNCSCNTSSSTMPKKEKNTRKYIFATSFLGAIYIVSMLILLVVCKSRHKRAKERKSTAAITTHKKGADTFQGLTFMSRMFSYEDIKKATLNFTTILGQGGFGKVYYGSLPTGEEIAVKTLADASNQGLKEFHNEVAILSKVRHKNLVSLIGYCVENTYMLIYEYVAKGNVRDLIYGVVESTDKPLPWKTRLIIALDASQGLEYLHMGCDPAIIHRDVKSSNILLSNNMQAKVADFGLSRLKESDNTISHVSTANVLGTAGYLDPVYNATNQLTDKSDVYSFGIVLFELICGRAPIDMFISPPHIVDWAIQAILHDKVGDILDPMLGKQYKLESIWRVINVAIGCVESDRVKRPKMSQVVQQLKNALEVEMDENIPLSSQDASGSSSTSDGKLPTLQYLESIKIKLDPR